MSTRASIETVAAQQLKYTKSNYHHTWNCPGCRRCNQVGHIAKYYTEKVANGRPRQTYFECESLNHLRSNCPRLNRALNEGNQNRPNPVLDIEGNQNQRNNRNQPRGRAFFIAANEAQQDPNIMTGTFSLNDHFATILFDFGADFSFISTEFLPLINAKPSTIIPRYEIEIANGLKIETNKIVHGCRIKLEVIMEYLVKDSKRRTFWSLNEDILEITILKTNMPYPSRKIQRIRACTHQRPRRKEDQYAISRRSQYAVLKI
ncbi:putative reverse transcriptase domain-containing protein [Tanacetum coccineum]